MSRENFELVLAHQQPHAFVHMCDHRMILLPGEHNIGGEQQPNGTIVGKDWFGCTWTELGNGAIDGCTITPNTTPLDDIADFAGHIPTAEQVRAYDWKGYAEQALAGFDRSNQLLEAPLPGGLFLSGCTASSALKMPCARSTRTLTRSMPSSRPCWSIRRWWWTAPRSTWTPTS